MLTCAILCNSGDPCYTNDPEGIPDMDIKGSCTFASYTLHINWGVGRPHIDWLIVGGSSNAISNGGAKFRGSMPLPGSHGSGPMPFGLAASRNQVKSRTPVAIFYLTDLHVESNDRHIHACSGVQFAHLHPWITHMPSTEQFRTDMDAPMAHHLILESVNGSQTPKEINGIAEYLLNFVMPSSNYHNYFERRRLVANMYAWAFGKTGDMRLVDKAIEFAYAALNARNDRTTKYDNVHGKVPPWW